MAGGKLHLTPEPAPAFRGVKRPPETPGKPSYAARAHIRRRRKPAARSEPALERGRPAASEGPERSELDF